MAQTNKSCKYHVSKCPESIPETFRFSSLLNKMCTNNQNSFLYTATHCLMSPYRGQMMETLAVRSDDLMWPETLPEILHGASGGVWLVMSVGLFVYLSLFSARISRFLLTGSPINFTASDTEFINSIRKSRC